MPPATQGAPTPHLGRNSSLDPAGNQNSMLNEILCISDDNTHFNVLVCVLQNINGFIEFYCYQKYVFFKLVMVSGELVVWVGG